MRNTIVSRKFNVFGVNHQETKVFWTILVHQTYNQAVQCNGFTRACCTCNKQVRHLGKVAKNNVTNQVLTDGKHKFASCILKFVGFQQTTQQNWCFLLVSNFDTNQVCTLNWRMNQDVFRCLQACFEVVCISSKVAHTSFFGSNLKTILCYRWTNNNIYWLNFDTKHGKFTNDCLRGNLMTLHGTSILNGCSKLE